MAKHFGFLSDLWQIKERPGHRETSWFKAARKSGLGGIVPLVVLRRLTGARSVTSCAKFTSKSSLVDPAQTIKGAAGMTSGWKIPHLQRWKMTCGFLSAEANSAVWQGESGGSGGKPGSISRLSFYTQSFVKVWKTLQELFGWTTLKTLLLQFQPFHCNYCSYHT